MTLLPSPKSKQSNRQSASHDHAPKQESALAKRFKGKVVKASGALDEKGDVRIKGIARIEAKCTKHSSFRVTQEMIQKIELAAVADNELPVIVIDFLDDRGNPHSTMAVMPMYALDDFMSRKA